MPSNDDQFYSRANPRYGVTESFPPPRTFDTATGRSARASKAAQTPDGHMRSSLRRRVYAAEAAHRANRRIFSRRLRNPARSMAVLVLVIALAAIAWMGAGQLGGALGTLAGTPDANEPPSSTDAVSTPRGEWRRGAVPFLFQTDAQWAQKSYAGGTVAENGCGPTCLSMVYVALTGRTDYDPAAMAAFSEDNGHVTDGLTAWTLMTDGARQLGLASQEVPADATQVADALRTGTPIIASVGPGDFTTEGHFIVLAGIDDEGRALVHDPNSPERSSQTWDIPRILNQARNLWAFSA